MRRFSTLRYISLGAGVQSSALLAISDKGLHDCPRADVAIFADTQGEPEWVYDQVEALKRLSTIPIRVVTAGDLAQDVIDRHNGKRKRFSAIPVFTEGSDGASGPLRRQCTREYKIEPIQREVRRLCGIKPKHRFKGQAFAMIGISLDELHRAGESRQKWVRNEYPLIDAGLRRGDCIKILEDIGWPVPKKSACRFCPYHSNAYWRDLKQSHPDEWDKAVAFDHAVRDMSRSGRRRPVFLHRSLKPLDEVNLGENQGELFDEECAGVCGV